ncbi:thiamine biosynthetic bifunctional enzyme Thi4 [Crassisporium funariophilum]|nr:thiamine biosynthetic bifunctional enzyme Thi4 [Crassisporium funariophilum]
MRDIDYSLYLVTGRALLPANKDYLEALEEAIKGGVTLVQIREKDVDTREFIRIAAMSKTICDKYNIPIIINDRVDVALAMGADGVHLGQSDMTVEQARKLLPPDLVIGVSCNTVEHVKVAIRDKVDYVGIGAVWGTQTKKLTSPVIGVRGVGAMLEALDGTNIKSVGIGGIKSSNLLRTLHGAVSTTNHALDGVAVVSDIMGTPEPQLASQNLRITLSQFRQSFSRYSAQRTKSKELFLRENILAAVSELMENIRELNPLVHQITNVVVATQAANTTLAVGASPIMATEPREMEDLARITGALLINIGTMRAENLDGMVKAGMFANGFKKPIVFDPVGVGASAFRKEAVKTLLNSCQVSVIKGNAGELAALSGTAEVESRGVDSVGGGFKDPAAFVKKLARAERCVVVLTGPIDYISDGESVIMLENGDDVLARITASGCILGSIIASYCAVAASLAQTDPEQPGNMLIAAIAGVLVLTVAAEVAVKTKNYVQGPGTFLPGLIDVLWTLSPAQVQELSRISVRHV